MQNEQAFNIVLQIVNAHNCNKQDRVIFDEALTTLYKLVQTAATVKQTNIKTD